MVHMAKWLTRLTVNQVIVGSNPIMHPGKTNMVFFPRIA